MPTQIAPCKKEFDEWVECFDLKAKRGLAWDYNARFSFNRKPIVFGWSCHVRKEYESAKRTLRVFRWHHRSRSQTNTLEHLFREYAERWKNNTGHWSSTTRRIADADYLSIIALAQNSVNHQIEKLLLQELQHDPDEWFDALTAITKENPVKPEYDFDEAINAWVEWGRKRGII